MTNVATKSAATTTFSPAVEQVVETLALVYYHQWAIDAWSVKNEGLCPSEVEEKKNLPFYGRTRESYNTVVEEEENSAAVWWRSCSGSTTTTVVVEWEDEEHEKEEIKVYVARDNICLSLNICTGALKCHTPPNDLGVDDLFKVIRTLLRLADELGLIINDLTRLGWYTLAESFEWGVDKHYAHIEREYIVSHHKRWEEKKTTPQEDWGWGDYVGTIEIEI